MLILQVSQDQVEFHQHSKEKLEGLVSFRLYPPAIHYAVTYSRPPDFEHPSLEVLKVVVTGTDQPQVTFPLPVYCTTGECMCLISQVCGEALPSSVVLPHYSFVKHNAVEMYHNSFLSAQL